jgi:hypothetical protein
VNEFISRAAALDGHYKKTLAELPNELRLLVELSFDFRAPTGGSPTPIHTPIPGVGRRQVLLSDHWDYLTPLQREALAKQYDALFNPIFSRHRREENFRQGFEEGSETVPARIVAHEPRDRDPLPPSSIITHPQSTRGQTGQAPVYDPPTVYSATKVPKQFTEWAQAQHSAGIIITLGLAQDALQGQKGRDNTRSGGLLVPGRGLSRENIDAWIKTLPKPWRASRGTSPSRGRR